MFLRSCGCAVVTQGDAIRIALHSSLDHCVHGLSCQDCANAESESERIIVARKPICAARTVAVLKLMAFILRQNVTQEESGPLFSTGRARCKYFLVLGIRKNLLLRG